MYKEFFTKPSTIIGIVVLSVIFLMGISLLAFVSSSYNTERRYRIEIEQYQKSVKISYDKMHKVIEEKAGAVRGGEDAFADSFTKIAQAQTSQSQNLLAQFLTTQYPQLNPRLREELLRSIEVERSAIEFNFKRLIDLQTRHSIYIGNFPRNILAAIFGWKATEIKLVTSTGTEKAFEDGMDDRSPTQ